MDNSISMTLDASQQQTPGKTGLQPNQLRRRMARLRDAGMFTDAHHSPLVVTRATTYDDLSQAYSLVHDAYVRHQYINPHPSGMRVRIYEALPETATFVAKVGNRVVGVLGVVPDSQDIGLPSDHAFGGELDILRAAGRRIAEVTNLAVADDYRSTGVFLQLTRYLYAHTLHRHFDDLFIAISPGHALFFEALLGFQAWGERRCYDHSTQDTVEGKRIDLVNFPRYAEWADQTVGDYSQLRQWFLWENPYFRTVLDEDPIARRHFLTPGVLYELFVHQTSLLADLDPAMKNALCRRWGTTLFNSLDALAQQSDDITFAAA